MREGKGSEFSTAGPTTTERYVLDVPRSQKEGTTGGGSASRLGNDNAGTSLSFGKHRMRATRLELERIWLAVVYLHLGAIRTLKVFGNASEFAALSVCHQFVSKAINITDVRLRE